MAGYFSSLESLDLSNTLSDNADENKVLLCTLLPAIASHCPCLKTLDLSQNNLGVPGACALGDTFHQFISSKESFDINLSETSLDSVAVMVLTEKILGTLSVNIATEVELKFDDNPVGYNGLVSIFKLVATRNCGISQLELCSLIEPNIVTYNNIQFCADDLAGSRQLTKISMYSFSAEAGQRGEIYVNCLEAAIIAGALPNLEKLDVSNFLGNSRSTNKSLLTKLLPAIASYCPYLEDLDLSRNNLGTPGATALGEAFWLLITTRNQLDLDLHKCNLDSEAVTAFSEIITHKLSSLNTFVLRKSMKCDINLSENPIGQEGLVAIFNILTLKHCPISKLSLDDLVLESGSQYRNAQQVNPSATDLLLLHSCVEINKLKTLSMSNACIGGDCNWHIRYLEKAIKTGALANMEDLDLSNSLTKNAHVNASLLTTLLPAIASYCPHLIELNLSQNKLCVPAAQVLGEMLPLFISGRKQFDLNLKECFLDSEAVTAITRIYARPYISSSNTFWMRSQFTLCLNENPIGHKGLLAIFANCSFTRLEVCYLKTESHIQQDENFCVDNLYQSTLKTLDMENHWTSHWTRKSRAKGELLIKCLKTAAIAGVLVNLERLDLRKTVPDANKTLLTPLLTAIASCCPHLNNLNLSNNELGVAGARALGETFLLLINSRKRFNLDLSENNLDSKAMAVFSEKMADTITSLPKSVSMLNEYDLCLNENPFGYEGFITTFQLKDCPITTLKINNTIVCPNGETKWNSKSDSLRFRSEIMQTCVSKSAFEGY